MTLPPRSESRRLGLEILSLYLYEGPGAASRLLASTEDPEMVYAVACYWLKALGEFVEAGEVLGITVAEQLERMGQRLLATDDEEER